MLTGGIVDAGSPPASGRRDHGSFADAPIGRRAVARVVDFGVGVAFFAGLLIVVTFASGPSPDGTGVMLVALTGTFFAYLLYEVMLVGMWGRTLGKALMGLEVVRVVDGARPGVRRAFLRALVPAVVLVVFFPIYPLAYVVAAVTAGHRWPNDRLAGTRVVLRA